jgi:hypothetical protein
MSKKYQIFISSTFEDLKEQRDAVVKAVLQMGHLPVGMEMFNAGEQTQWETIKGYIDNSDYYLVILAHRYGSRSIDGDKNSYTEKEYDYAGDRSVPRLGFVIEKGAPWPNNHVEGGPAKKKLDAFKKKVGSARVIKFWDTTDKLSFHVFASLSNEINVNPRVGWVRSSEASSTQVAEELARLSKENKDLQNRLLEFQNSSKSQPLEQIIRKTFVKSTMDSSSQVNLEAVFVTVCKAQPNPTAGDITNKLNIRAANGNALADSDDQWHHFHDAVTNALNELQLLGVVSTKAIKPEGRQVAQFASLFLRDVWNITEKGTTLYTTIQYLKSETQEVG